MYMHQVPEFLPNAIPSTSTTLRLVVGLLLSYHVTISYILNNQPLSNALHAMISPETLLDYDTYKGRFIWMCITSTLLVFSIGVANSIPFFSTFQSSVGSLMGAPLMFGWPAYFYWKASFDMFPSPPCVHVYMYMCVYKDMDMYMHLFLYMYMWM